MNFSFLIQSEEFTLIIRVLTCTWVEVGDEGEASLALLAGHPAPRGPRGGEAGQGPGLRRQQAHC